MGITFLHKIIMGKTDKKLWHPCSSHFRTSSLCYLSADALLKELEKSKKSPQKITNQPDLFSMQAPQPVVAKKD